jgi:hypothetical protein
MPLGQLATGEHPEDVLRELEQANAVRDRGLGLADALRDTAEAEPELVEQHA